MKVKTRIFLIAVLAVVLCIGGKILISMEGGTGSENSAGSEDPSGGEESEGSEGRSGSGGSAGGEVEIVDNFIWMDWEAATRDDGDIEIKYDITDNGNNYYNIDVTLENILDEKIDNWEIWIPVNYEIRKIWDAKIIDHYDGKYVIHCTESNQDIPVGGSVSFGMTATCSDKPEMPRFVNTFAKRKDVREKDYKVELRTQSSGRKHEFTGRIIITNKKEKRLEDWGIDLYSNFQITKIQDAVLVDQLEPRVEGGDAYQEIENPGTEQNIEPGERVEFEFSGVCDEKPKLSDTRLTEVTSEDDEEDEDDEDEE